MKKGHNSIERAAMKELFQQDIDDTVSEILANERVQEKATESVSTTKILYFTPVRRSTRRSRPEHAFGGEQAQKEKGNGSYP